MIPGHLVPHNGSPINWSLWINSPQPILSPWIDGPPKFGPHGQMVPNQFGPPRQMVPRIFHMSRGTGCGDLELLGLNCLGTIYPGGLNFGGPFAWGTEFVGDHLSREINFMGIICQGGLKLGTRSSGIKWFWRKHHIFF